MWVVVWCLDSPAHPTTAFSADPEFCRPFFKKFLEGHNITVNERPSRSSAKNGKVERNNGVLKNVLSRIIKERTDASHLFHGSTVLSSFQLAQGYAPSIAGISKSMVPKELLETHTQRTANRALQKVLRSEGVKIWVYYKTSKQNERVRWVSAEVVEARDHLVLCRRAQHSKPMSVAYEHIRIAPTEDMACELMRSSLEDKMAQKMDVVSTDQEDKDEIAEESGTAEEIVDQWGDGVDDDSQSGLEDSEMLTNELSEDSDQLQITGKERDKSISFMTRAVQGRPELEIGTQAVIGPPERSDMHDLESTLQLSLDEVYKVVGSAKPT